jgi:hypothetical protein
MEDVDITRSLGYHLKPSVRQCFLGGQPLPGIYLHHLDNKILKVRLKLRPDAHRASLNDVTGDKGKVATSRVVTSIIVDKSANAVPVRAVRELALYQALYHDIFGYRSLGEFALIDYEYYRLHYGVHALIDALSVRRTPRYE